MLHTFNIRYWGSWVGPKAIILSFCAWVSVNLDINECTEGLHDCHLQANTECFNTYGSYVCNCQIGYQLNGHICRGKFKSSNLTILSVYIILSPDVDECESSHICEQFCINNDGSFICECRANYTKTRDHRSCLGKMVFCTNIGMIFVLTQHYTHWHIDDCLVLVCMTVLIFGPKKFVAIRHILTL